MKIIMDTLGFEPRAFRMRSGYDTTTPCALVRCKSTNPFMDLKKEFHASAHAENQVSKRRMWGEFAKKTRLPIVFAAHSLSNCFAFVLYLRQRVAYSILMTAVGFEPTQLALVELESAPLDHSGKLSW